MSIDGSFTYPGTGPNSDGTRIHFDPMQYKDREGLILVNGVVYTSWASHSDVAPYTGWVIGFHASDLSPASVVNVDPNGTPVASFLQDGSGSSFWNSGAGPAADAAGNLYNVSANGPFDPSRGDYGDSFIKFSTTNGLAVADYFAPANQQALANSDEDLGSSGITLADAPDNSGVVHHLAIGSGKDGNIYVVDRDNLGHSSASNNNIYQEIPGGVGGSGLFAAPAAFDGKVYLGGVGTTLKVFQFVDGKLTASPVSQTADTFAYPGTTPSISSNGHADGIVWAYSNTDPVGLRAYDANNLATKLYDSTLAPNGRDNVGAGNKFITPMIANGKVYVATQDGVGVFGLFPPVAPPPFAAHVNFTSNPGQVPPGYVDDVGQVFGPRAGGLSFGWNCAQRGRDGRSRRRTLAGRAARQLRAHAVEGQPERLLEPRAAQRDLFRPPARGRPSGRGERLPDRRERCPGLAGEAVEVASLDREFGDRDGHEWHADGRQRPGRPQQ